MPDDDRVTAALDEIRERAERLRTRYGYVGGLLELAKAKDDIPRLLKAVEDALKLAAGWKQESARLEHSGADAVSNAGPGSYLVSGRLGALEDCAEGLREAITAALTGEEAGDGDTQ